MEITWLGHSAIKIKGSKTVYIDPFLTGNPVASTTPDAITEADVVIVTHDHGDHKGDSFNICKRTGATLVSVHEVAVQAEEEGIPAEGMNIGGTIESNGVIIHMVQALHSAECGDPTGVVVELDGQKLYHAGDTDLIPEMEKLADAEVDVALLPSGDTYTMDLDEAAEAALLIKPKIAIPMHLKGADPAAFKEKVESQSEIKWSFLVKEKNIL